MLNKLKKDFKGLQGEISDIIKNTDFKGSNKEWSYLTSEEKRIHLKVRQRLNEYLEKDEEVLIETNTSKLGVNTSYFFTDRRILEMRPLDMFKTGSKLHISSHYYNVINHVSFCQSKKKYNEIGIAVTGSLGALGIKVQSKIAKDIFDLLNNKLSKNKSGC